MAEGCEVGGSAVPEIPLNTVGGARPAQGGGILGHVGDVEVRGGRAGAARGGKGHHIAPFACSVAAAVALHLEDVLGFGIQTSEVGVVAGGGDGLPFSWSVDDEVIDIKIVLVGAVVVAEGHVTLLAGIGAQVNDELLPFVC